MASAIVHFLCCIWVVSLIATIDYEHQGVHTGLDARRAVLADYDVDCDTVNPAQPAGYSVSEWDPQVDAPAAAESLSANTPSCTPSCMALWVLHHLKIVPGAFSPTVLRL